LKTAITEPVVPACSNDARIDHLAFEEHHDDQHRKDPDFHGSQPNRRPEAGEHEGTCEGEGLGFRAR
jgi:hypothetical protein